MSSTTDPELIDKTTTDIAYLMENDEEALRLEIKTDIEAVRDEARWCGLKPGMRVLDAGCGPGLVTSILHEFIKPNGFILGVDYSTKRVEYANKKYANRNEIEFYLHDLRKPLKDIGTFDLIWARFVLEYFREEAFSIVKNFTKLLKPGGFLCLLDLDYNCLTHYELPPKMGKILFEVMIALENDYNFDPYAGRRLYSYLYDLGFKSIQVNLKAHHLIYGPLGEEDLFNWTKKIHVACLKTKLIFKDYPGQIDGFLNDFNAFFCSPRRLTYTPLLMCKGRKIDNI